MTFPFELAPEIRAKVDEINARRGIRYSAPLRIGSPIEDRYLSTREVEVLQRVAEGDRNCDIASTLVISEETVKCHVRHILDKLEARSRAHAVAIGLRRKLIA